MTQSMSSRLKVQYFKNTAACRTDKTTELNKLIFEGFESYCDFKKHISPLTADQFVSYLFMHVCVNAISQNISFYYTK